MTDFLSRLPKPCRSEVPGETIISKDVALASYSLVSAATTSALLPIKEIASVLKTKPSVIPPYGSRTGWIPHTAEDFGDGGAYPELSIAQFPLGMGAAGSSVSSTVALQTGPDGKLQYDAVIKQNLESRLAVHTKPSDAKGSRTSTRWLQKPSDADVKETEEKTRVAIEAIVANKLTKDIVKNVNQKPEYIRYTPNQQTPGHNANCSQRLVRMVEAQIDPLEPPKFRHKRIPRGPPSPPPAILHSPPRKLSAEDQAAWKIPPCVSNWKNQKGYTIPLDKRLQADGRSIQDISVNDKFATLSESLYIAERSAREEIRLRNELVKEQKQMEEAAREKKLRDLAASARAERAALFQKQKQIIGESSEGEAMQKRKEVERERRREIERDLRFERAGKKSKEARNEDRDISERIALGQAKPTSKEALFDSRLFNQSAGLDSGFEAGLDDKYNIYTKPLFVDRSKQSTYVFDQERMAQSVGELADLPSFQGATSRQRTAPVEFEADMSDPFGLAFLLEKSSKKQ